jgi:acyl carrier protein
MSLLKKVAKEVLLEKPALHQLTFVLPTKRSCIFLEKELVQHLGTASFLPRILTIEKFFQELAELDSIENVQLLFEFYKVYLQQTPPEEKVAFDIFMQWASIVLNDFNEIDSHLVASHTLFTNLTDVKKLNDWFENNEPTKLSLDYLKFFDKMEKLYTGLTQQLLQNHHGYNGLIQRTAVKNLDNFVAKKSDEQFIFIGFNALTKAEETVFQKLLDAKLAKLYWDASDEMMKSENNAGKYLRRYKSTWKFYQSNEFKWVTPTKEKYIEVAGAPKNVSQFKHVGNLLKNIDPLENTTLVLGDEALLSLAINSIPEDIKHMNVGMGLPLQSMPVTKLFESLFKLHLNQQKFDKLASNELYYKDLLKLLNHPLLMTHFEEEIFKISEFIKKNNFNFVPLAALQSALNKEEGEFLAPVFKLLQPEGDVGKFIQKCKEFLLFLKPRVEGMALEQLFQVHQIFEKLTLLNQKYSYLKNINTLHAVFNVLVKQAKLSFKGAPLKGLQVMGILETRALDFDTLILTSVNEGMIPQKGNQQSFIPFDVKKYHGLPTDQDKNNIFAYHFYRLIQSSNKVFLTYNSETDSFGSGEKSRFITELQIAEKINKAYLLNPNMAVYSSKKQTIPKTPNIMAKLRDLCSHGLTPSALTTYNANPILFYEKYVLKIKEVEEVEETIAENTMGTVIHEVLYELYSKFVGKNMVKSDLKILNTHIEPLLIKAFETHFKKGSLKSGKNKLIYEICKTNVKRFLMHEAALLDKGSQLRILALEENLKVSIPLKGIDHEINIRGIVDRIDEFGGSTRIIDYKTGRVTATDLKFTDFEKLHEHQRYSKAFQVMMYTYLYVKTNPQNLKQPPEAGIFSFKNLNEGFLSLNFSEKPRQRDTEITKEKIVEFEKILTGIISEILNPKVDFTQPN